MAEGRDQKTRDEKNRAFHRKKVGSRFYYLVNLMLSILETLRFIALQIVCGILEGRGGKITRS